MIDILASDTRIVLPFTAREVFDDYVTPTSPRSLRQAVFRIAKYFKREGEFDFTQFAVDDDSDYSVYLFRRRRYNSKTDRYGSEIYGAACFRKRDKKKGGSSDWCLQWIWLHPYFRGKGALKKTWSQFLRDFGQNFYVETPYSREMLAFLKKHASEAQRMLFRSLGWSDLFPEEKGANQSQESTAPSVAPRAAQELQPAMTVAHLYRSAGQK